MLLGSNLATRIIALLLIGFVLLQLILFTALALPGHGSGVRPYNLPLPVEVAAMAHAIETAPPPRRPALVSALNGSLFSVHLMRRYAPSVGEPAPDLEALRAGYVAALPGHIVAIEGAPGRLGRAIRERPGPLHYLSPIRIAVTLNDGEALVIDSRASAFVRDYLRQRALQGLLGGLVVLGALIVAVRQTTRPLVHMSEGVRRFATTLDAPDLPVTGSQEVRDLSTAFNDMKGRIGGLVADRTRILAAVAHDMRTYLTRLRLRAEYIDDPEQRARAVADLEEMALLLDDTLLFARTDGGTPARPERLDLRAELATIVADRQEIGQAVTLNASASVEIMADRLALRRMLANLIDNGLRYGSIVSVTLDVGGDTRVIVSDNGPGVPAGMLARLGLPYARLDPSRDRSSGGAGLGLAIVRALADQAGARLEIANGDPHGLVVALIFPILMPA
jgi:signal transduction histidine kinase